MKIKETCSCGAEFEVESNSSSDAGYRYGEFLVAHKICREADSMRSKTVTTVYTEPDEEKEE